MEYEFLQSGALMLGGQVVRGGETLRVGQGSPRCLGVVSGYVLKLVREAVNITQSGLAEGLNVDVATVQGWESGRRPLTALRTSDLVLLRTRLNRLGAAPGVGEMFSEAIEADLVIAEAVEAGGQATGPRDHPLAWSVHRRSLMNMITWPFTGVLPSPLRRLPQPRRARRGPVPDRPVLHQSEQVRFFDHLLTLAQACMENEDALLRRQAIYLLGFDSRDDSIKWLHDEQRRALRSANRTDHVPSWVVVRSSAVALAQKGDREPLQRFVRAALVHEAQEFANLNYWAYWVGEIDETQPDDGFMVSTDPESWSGVRLCAHLIERLRPDSELVDLNMHTLWMLILARPALLEQHPRLRARARSRIEHTAEAATLTPQASRELASLAYATRLAGR